MKYKICKKCVVDSSIKSIVLDLYGICQYCKMHDEMNLEFPGPNKQSKKNLLTLSEKIKSDGKNKKYDCIVGVSGGRDSSYLLYYIKKELGLRPLAVHYDNGFGSDISVSNIYKVCEKLDVDLETVVANWEKFKKITKSFFLASVCDPDTPTDVALLKAMNQAAYKENIKYIFNGHSFRTEGIEPLDWTYMDGHYIKDVHKKFGDGILKNFDNYTMFDLIKFNFLRNIKTIFPLNFIDYNYDQVEKILTENLGWSYYGGHHHENLLTKFIVSYYLPVKFGIDRRRTSLSAMVREKKMKREEAIDILKKRPLIDRESDLIKYVLEKLDISENDFQIIMENENKNFKDYNTYYNYIKYFKTITKISYKLDLIPKILYLKYFGSNH